MRRFLFFIASIMLFGSLFSFAFIGTASAHGVATSQVRPLATGGGCSSYRGSSQGGFSANACINYSWFQINTDGYVNFHPSKRVTGCYLYVGAYDSGFWSKSYDCTSDANAHHSVHYTNYSEVRGSGSYQGELYANLTYSDGSSDIVDVYSPIQHV